MKSHTLFISDLHLEEKAPEVAALFLQFMKDQAPKADALCILGDFFEAWIGDDDKTAFNQKIVLTLRSLVKSGTPIYFMRGNRDFLIGEKFTKTAGVTLLEDPTIISLYGKSVLLMHGDSLCTLDRKHQAYRRKTTKRWVRKLMLSLPLNLRRKLADRLRKKSCNRNRHLSNEITEVVLEEVLRIMRQMDVELLIHGHTHHPAIHDFLINKKPAKRIVLGAWHEHGSALHYFSNSEFELSFFKLNLKNNKIMVDYVSNGSSLSGANNQGFDFLNSLEQTDKNSTRNNTMTSIQFVNYRYGCDRLDIMDS